VKHIVVNTIMEEKKMRLSLMVTALLIPVAISAQTANGAHATPALKWGPAPPAFPAGAQLAVLQGDPGQAGEYTVRLRMPAGYRIQPHTHPTDENVTVISGHLMVGMGDSFTTKSALSMPVGAFATATANQPHFAWTKGRTTLQVHGMGPFQLTYVNPADDPQNKKPE
jgi:quercetin dioxygenase-like cupin family protein